MTMTDNNTMPGTRTIALTIGAEVWAEVNDSLVRQAATPSIGDLDAIIGKQHERAIAEVIDRVYASRSPRLLELEAGSLTAMIWPVNDRDQVSSIVVVYFARRDGAALAAELWTGREGRSELCLSASSYTGLDRFAKLSPYISFPKGSGLPGMVWETNIPQIIDGLSQSHRFMRATGAASEGLDLGFGMPCVNGGTLHAVALLLSGQRDPVARAIETWCPMNQSGSIRLARNAGAYVDAPTVQKASESLHLPAGDTWIGMAWATRQPVVVCDSSSASLSRRGAAEDGLTQGLAIPIIVLDDVAAVAVMMW